VSGAVAIPFPALHSGAMFLAFLGGFVGIGLALHGIAVLRFGAERVGAWSSRIEGLIFCFFLAVMILLSGLQIALRNLFHGGVLWIDPFVRILVLWVAFLGALAATSHGRHLHIDVIRRLLRPEIGIPVDRVLAVGAAVCCALLANGAFIYLRDEYQHGISPFLGIPSWAVQSILLWGFALLCYRFLVQAIWPIRVHPITVSEFEE